MVKNIPKKEQSIKLPFDVEMILDTLHIEGYKAYVVGGCVRDVLMNRIPHDWDITTNALPDEVRNLFSNHNIIDTGIKHGTVTIVIDKTPYEITTFRVDGDYTDGRHPDSVSFTPSLEEDLARRDFTINAMAYNYEDGLIDPYNGQEDINNKWVNCVGSHWKDLTKIHYAY